MSFEAHTHLKNDVENKTNCCFLNTYLSVVKDNTFCVAFNSTNVFFLLHRKCWDFFFSFFFFYIYIDFYIWIVQLLYTIYFYSPIKSAGPLQPFKKEQTSDKDGSRRVKNQRTFCILTRAYIDWLAKQFVLPNLTMIYHYHNFRGRSIKSMAPQVERD